MRNKKLISWALVLVGIGIVGYTNFNAFSAAYPVQWGKWEAGANLAAAVMILVGKCIGAMKR